MDGINTKRLVVKPEEAANIRLMFEMYAQPTTSYGDITRYFAELGILFNRPGTDTPHAGADVTQPRLCAGGLGCVRVFQEPGDGACQ